LNPIFKNLKKIQRKPGTFLRKAIGKKPNVPITELKINGVTSNDPGLIANEFNDFFSKIGSKIAWEVVPTDRDPISYMPNLPDIPLLEMGQTSPEEIKLILKTWIKKQS